MSVSSTHLTRRIAAIPADGPPVTASGPDGAKALLARFEEVARAEPFFTKSHWQNPGRLTLQFPSERWGPGTIDFEVEKEGRLVFRGRWNGEPVPVTSERHFLAMLAAVRAAAERERALRLRREKVNHLRFKAMEAQVRELARAGGFEYRFESKSNKVKLGIKLDAKRELMLDLPYKSFQAVLDALPTFLPQLRALLSLPIRFAIESAQGWHKWESPPAPALPPGDGDD